MTQSQFHHLARQIIARENTGNMVQRVYWFKHFARLVSLVRNQNLFGA